MNRQAVGSAFGAEVASDPARRIPRDLAGSPHGLMSRATVPFPLARTGGLDLPRSNCPCCGAPISAPTDFDRMLETLSPVARRAVIEIARRPGLSGRDLASVVYADCPDGGPLNAQTSISVALAHNRERLAAYGFDVRSRMGGRIGGYRLIRLSPNEGAA